jgi:hypothetical protein
MLEKFTPRYQALVLLLFWGALVLTSGVLRFDAYGIDEAAARALLLVWSIVDRVINPIIVLGLPDLRALLFAPVGIYWPGSIIAAKVFTALIAFGGILMCYVHYKRESKDEAALIGTGLLLIAPLTLAQINAIAAGPYLLLGFYLGPWLDQAYRRSQRPWGGWFFLHLLLIMVLTSIHPLALAYPLALIIEWYRKPLNIRQQRHIFIGVAIAVVFTLLLRGGWPGIDWFSNPFPALAAVIWGRADSDPLTLTSGLLALLLVILLALRFKHLLADFHGRTLLLAVIPGLLYADLNWAFIVLAVFLYIGSLSLIQLNSKLGGQSFIGQRGLALLVLFVVATLFMQGDRARQQAIQANALKPEDTLIQELALELEDASVDSVQIMSQWPGRTMLATRRQVFPLPPDYADSKTLLRNIKGTTHIIFNPRDPANRKLAQHLSDLTAVSETLYMGRGGVIIGIDTSAQADKPGQTKATKTPADSL